MALQQVNTDLRRRDLFYGEIEPITISDTMDIGNAVEDSNSRDGMEIENDPETVG